MNLYVAATRQNDGKTTTALGLFNAIKETFSGIGYIKPVGQQVKLIGKHKIDKDVSLMSEIYQIGNHLYDMSPITVPKGFTEDYILHGDPMNLRRKILQAYTRASKGKGFMVIEGTGHAGVGSIFDLSNAAVAQLLQAPVLLVTCAGIGRPIDEVMLNKAVFDSFGVPVLGVIVNKVMPEKYEKINKFVRLGFQRKGIDVLGVLPFCPILSSPTVRQLLEDIRGDLLCGEEAVDQGVSRMIVGAMPPHTALDYFKGQVVLITPGNREDLILAALSANATGTSDENNVRGMILTGGIKPNKTVMQLLAQGDMPVISVQDDTFTTAQKITNLIIKIRPQDEEKIRTIKDMVHKHVDVDRITEKLEAAPRMSQPSCDVKKAGTARGLPACGAPGSCCVAAFDRGAVARSGPRSRRHRPPAPYLRNASMYESA